MALPLSQPQVFNMNATVAAYTKSKDELIAPMIHLNGTSRKDIESQIDAAWDALNQAYELMKKAAPNGRDYYPLPEGSLQKAIDQHTDRLARVHSVMNEYESVLELLS